MSIKNKERKEQSIGIGEGCIFFFGNEKDQTCVLFYDHQTQENQVAS